MINYKDYLNQEIINKEYTKCEKTYSSEISLKSGFIAFKDPLLQRQIQLAFQEQEEERKKKQEENALENEKFLASVREINETYKKLIEKAEILRGMFGNDFKYPPLVEFEKKHQQILNKRNKYRGLLSYRYGYQDDYISDPFWR